MLIGDWFVYQLPRALHGPPRYIYVGCGSYSLLTSCHVVSVYSWGCVKVYSLRLHHAPKILRTVRPRNLKIKLSVGGGSLVGSSLLFLSRTVMDFEPSLQLETNCVFGGFFRLHLLVLILLLLTFCLSP